LRSTSGDNYCITATQYTNNSTVTSADSLNSVTLTYHCHRCTISSTKVKCRYFTGLLVPILHFYAIRLVNTQTHQAALSAITNDRTTAPL